MNTYPTYPQPILTQASTGLNWYLEVTNDGTLRAGGTTTDAPTPLPRLKLVDPTGRAAYRLGLDASAVPTVTATALSTPAEASYQDLPIWGINGREWNLRVTSAGSLTINAISVEWPMLAQPTLLDPSGKPWRLQVTDAGIMETASQTIVPITESSTVRLRADDDSGSFTVSVDENGVLFVTGPEAVSLATYYEVLLLSSSWLRYPLSVDANGVLSIDTAMTEIETRDQWPLVLQSRSNVLYVVDTRFRAPIPGRAGRGYGHRRG